MTTHKISRRIALPILLVAITLLPSCETVDKTVGKVVTTCKYDANLVAALGKTKADVRKAYKSSGKKDVNPVAALMMPPALSRAHGSTKRKNAERKLKLPPAKVIQTIRKAEIARQASKLYVSKPGDGCSFRSVVPSSC